MRPYVQIYHMCFGKGNECVKTNLNQTAREQDQNQYEKDSFHISWVFP